MSNKDIFLFASMLSGQRHVEEEVVLQAIEEALAAVTAKRYEDEGEVSIRVAIDRETGDFETFRQWEVIADNPEEEVEFPEKVLTLQQAHETNPELNVGDVVEESIESIDFGRIGIQQAKQLILQKIREAERDKTAEQYEKRIGTLVSGVVKRVTREHIVLDMGENAEGIVMREELIGREVFQVNDRMRGYLYEIREERRGPQLSVSRVHPEFLKELFKIEVPEIGEEVINIMAAARDPGLRAKIAVKTNDGRIDPIGACVGMRGARVQAVSNELNGERVDIVLWDENPAQFVINAMAPAEVTSIVVDEETHSMDIVVAEEQLSQAIGRSGQNVRLASDLTGWTLNIMSEDQANEKQESESNESKSVFIEKLEVDADVAEVLVSEGYTTLEQLAYVGKEDLLSIEEFDEEIVEALQQRASDVLLMAELSGSSGKEPAADLLEVDGVDEALANQLAEKGIVERDDLADQATDELVELMGFDEAKASRLIMAARAHWFEDEEK